MSRDISYAFTNAFFFDGGTFFFPHCRSTKSSSGVGIELWRCFGAAVIVVSGRLFGETVGIRNVSPNVSGWLIGESFISETKRFLHLGGHETILRFGEPGSLGKGGGCFCCCCCCCNLVHGVRNSIEIISFWTLNTSYDLRNSKTKKQFWDDSRFHAYLLRCFLRPLSIRTPIITGWWQKPQPLPGAWYRRPLLGVIAGHGFGRLSGNDVAEGNIYVYHIYI